MSFQREGFQKKESVPYEYSIYTIIVEVVFVQLKHMKQQPVGVRIVTNTDASVTRLSCSNVTLSPCSNCAEMPGVAVSPDSKQV